MARFRPTRQLTSQGRLPREVVEAMRAELPTVADDVVAAIIAGVPSYQDALSGPMGETIKMAVRIALDGFLVIAPRENDPRTPRAPALDGAYQLGRGEARNGRTPEALLAAYRIGARTAWRLLSAIALRTGLSSEGLADFAELVFAYIDELSDASAAGHADERDSAGRVRQRYLEMLAGQLLSGAAATVVDDTAERAGWEPPSTLTAVLLPVAQVGAVIPSLPSATIELPEVPDLAGIALLLVPDLHDAGRAVLLRTVSGRSAVVGPSRPWREAKASYVRARRAQESGYDGDTERHLVNLILSADPEARADLRAAVLAPLAGTRAGTAEKLTETLRAWLLHHGRRDEIAAHLFVHPQTVRYRMNQLRELYGDDLDDPATVLALTVALG
ncbi:PucR family transcriptional regulator [Nocardioides insulae]|uniref:PucR family transcriptional regulator n=1 Tax=Nocardioides insulae TaxID=394734 RepID=UPI00041B2E69|nr:PucR family transcriptional regulator [Nocardioides insulae]